MLLHQYAIPSITCGLRVRLPFTNRCDSSMVRATDNHTGSSPVTSSGSMAEIGKRKALEMRRCKEAHHFLKNGEKN